MSTEIEEKQFETENPSGNKSDSSKQQSETEEECEKVFQPKRLVSYDVFMKYVKIHNESVDISEVFSKECFDEWIENRKRRPKEPEESFRKALVAHVSGKDDRKPFSPEVEFEILKRLRESQPWPCFKNSKNGASKIGERGLKKSSQGYHEAKRKRAEGFTGPPGLFISPYQYRYYPMGPPPHNPFNPRMFPGYYSYPPTQFYPHLPPPPKRKIVSSEAIDYEQSQQKIAAAINFVLHQVRFNSLSGTFAQVLAQFYSNLELRHLFYTVENLFTPTIATKMNVINTPRTQRKFIVPELNTKFDSSKEIGEVVLNIYGEVMRADRVAEKCLDYKANNNMFRTFYNPIERALTLSLCLNTLMNIGYCYSRWSLKKKGKGQVLLLQLRLGKDRMITCKLQDMTHKYTELFKE